MTSPQEDLYALIVGAILAHPRSQQVTIGPSELGTPCDHCLAAKLAGWRETSTGPAWRPQVGTCVHEWLELVVARAEIERIKTSGGEARYLMEERVMVGVVGGQEIWGTSDLYDVAHGQVIDHKIQGKTRIAALRRHGPSPVYRAQVHLYGLGFEARGLDVRTVSINSMPRDGELRDGCWWEEPYDRDLALAALARADRIAVQVAALTAVSDQARDTWITSLPRDPGCYSCARYPDWDKTSSSDLVGLLG